MHVIMLGGILQRIRHVQLAPDSLDAKRCVASGKSAIGEGTTKVDLGEGRVENVNGPVVEIRGVEVVVGAAGGKRQSLVNGACSRVVHRQFGSRPEGPPPSRNGSLLRGKKEEVAIE